MKLVIAGGGTGGHLFPGIAVAEALMALDPAAAVLFVGTERGIEARAVPQAGFDVAFIQIGGLKRVGLRKGLRTLVALPLAVWESLRILRRSGATAVLGVGGYASGPVLLAARLLGIPTAICEQNSVPGLTNRVLGRLVRRVYATFESSSSFFPASAFRCVGNPVRASFLRAAREPAVEPEEGLIFIFGGSQGARALNEAMPAAVLALQERGHRVRVLHQAGKAEVDAVAARYASLGLDAHVTHFIDDMVSAYRRATLVVCRAGATSCAEITALGVPSVLVPFPQAADDHQAKNAEELVSRAAALAISQDQLSTAAFTDLLASLLAEPRARAALAEGARRAGRLDAASVVARSAIEGFPNDDQELLVSRSGVRS